MPLGTFLHFVSAHNFFKLAAADIRLILSISLLMASSLYGKILTVLTVEDGLSDVPRLTQRSLWKIFF